MTQSRIHQNTTGKRKLGCTAGTSAAPEPVLQQNIPTIFATVNRAIYIDMILISIAGRDLSDSTKQVGCSCLCSRISCKPILITSPAPAACNPHMACQHYALMNASRSDECVLGFRHPSSTCSLVGAGSVELARWSMCERISHWLCIPHTIRAGW